MGDWWLNCTGCSVCAESGSSGSLNNLSPSFSLIYMSPTLFCQCEHPSPSPKHCSVIPEHKTSHKKSLPKTSSISQTVSKVINTTPPETLRYIFQISTSWETNCFSSNWIYMCIRWVPWWMKATQGAGMKGGFPEGHLGKMGQHFFKGNGLRIWRWTTIHIGHEWSPFLCYGWNAYKCEWIAGGRPLPLCKRTQPYYK